MTEEETMVTELPPDMREVKEEPEMLEESTNEEIKELRDEGIDIVNVPWISDDH